MISSDDEMRIFYVKLTLYNHLVMPGRRPIFASLVSNLFWGTRDFLFKATLEPASPEKRKAKAAKKAAKKREKGK
ncbi:MULTISPECIES: hypothetical protein [unclassified Ekhidna]|jgi:hypothetical protein|uniref:hypothetical protein n=1 Tax=unclassified Ekhidna TaxID=2632188 RepID=UPI0032E0047F